MALDGIEVEMEAEKTTYGSALETITEWLTEIQQADKKIMIIGNGGSAGVASHMATDFLKNGKFRAMAFNDSSLLTCLANDIGYEDVFATPISQFADPGDLLICISTSGSSENIIRGAKAAKAKGSRVITCSGFDTDNRLRGLGDVDFYVPSYSYGVVETLHQLIIHSILDAKLYCEDQIDIFSRNSPLKKEGK